MKEKKWHDLQKVRERDERLRRCAELAKLVDPSPAQAHEILLNFAFLYRMYEAAGEEIRSLQDALEWAEQAATSGRGTPQVLFEDEPTGDTMPTPVELPPAAELLNLLDPELPDPANPGPGHRR